MISIVFCGSESFRPGTVLSGSCRCKLLLFHKYYAFPSIFISLFYIVVCSFEQYSKTGAVRQEIPFSLNVLPPVLK